MAACTSLCLCHLNSINDGNPEPVSMKFDRTISWHVHNIDEWYNAALLNGAAQRTTMGILHVASHRALQNGRHSNFVTRGGKTPETIKYGILKLGTCEASRFDSNSNRTSRFNSKVTGQFKNFESPHLPRLPSYHKQHSLFNDKFQSFRHCYWD